MGKIECTKIEVKYIKDYEKNEYRRIDKSYFFNKPTKTSIKNAILDFQKGIERNTKEEIVTRIEYTYNIGEIGIIKGSELFCLAEIEIPKNFLGE